MTTIEYHLDEMDLIWNDIDNELGGLAKDGVILDEKDRKSVV